MKSVKIRLSLLVVIFVTVFMCFPITAKAEDFYFQEKIGVIVNEETFKSVSPLSDGIEFDKIKISNLKNSNKEIAEVKKFGNYTLKIKGKKVGKTKISFTAKCGNKSKKISATVYVCNYENPAKYFKVDGIDIKKKFKYTYEEQSCYGKTEYTMKVKNRKNIKLDVKAKSGWKISMISVAQDSGGVHAPLNLTSRYKDSVKVKKKINAISIQFIETKTGIQQNLMVRFK